MKMNIKIGLGLGLSLTTLLIGEQLVILITIGFISISITK